MSTSLETALAGFGVRKDGLGQPFLAFEYSEGNVLVNLALARADNVDAVIESFTRQMQMAAADLKREASGLIIAKEVPNGTRNPKGRQQSRSGRKG